MSNTIESLPSDSSSSRISRFLEGIEHWRDENDSPQYVEALISTPIRDVQAIHCPRRVDLNSSLIEVIEAFKGSRNVVVHVLSPGQSGDEAESRIFSRLRFLEHALQASSFSDPLSSIVEKVPVLGWVSGDDTLDIALQQMIATGFEEVGIMCEGMMTGVLQLDDIFSFLFREVAACEDDESDFKRTSANQIFPSNDNDGNAVIDKVERDERIKEKSALQLSALHWCDNGWTETLIMFCILLDVSCAAIEWLNGPEDDADQPKLLVATGVILFIYVFEMAVRVVGRRRMLFELPFEMLDASIVITSIAVFALILASALPHSVSSTTLMRILRLMRQIKVMRYVLRWYASHKLKYRQDGFYLDLSYITSSCIAMSRPMDIPDAKFVNPIKEVRRFFTTKYKRKYLIFNLCHESSYEDEYFGGRVEKIKIQCHNPPSMHQIVTFVEQAGRFLGQNGDGCIAVHCTHGTGRTGAMIACWLMYSTFASTADDAMKWFASRRIGKRAGVAKGVPMVSQRRYVTYLQDALADGGYYTKRLELRRITVKHCPMMDAGGGCNLWFTVEEGGMEVFCSSGVGKNSVITLSKGEGEVNFDLGILVAGDVRIIFFHRNLSTSTDRLCFFLCFHTGFLKSKISIFEKPNVDMAAEDAKCKVFSKDFAVHLEFDDIPEPNSVLTPSTRDAGVALGPFRRIVKPSRQLVEAAALMRCRDLDVQAKFARALQQNVKRTTRRSLVIRLQNHAESRGKTMLDGIESFAIEDDKKVQQLESLCCASGPVVEHESVQMFKAEGHSLPPQLSQTPIAPTGLVSLKPITRSVQGLARSLVSGNKRRFVEDGFDLDLSYVTPRIIAMGYPSHGIEGHYRNPVHKVYRFFQERHAAHYLIFNLCSEREYELDTFHGNCVRYPFPDHNPPALEIILPCCARMHEFLQADPNNVVAVHCKAGKGRTGLMVVCYLMYCGQHNTASSARLFYDWTRTKDGKGLTITSQIRYAHYFERMLRSFKLGLLPGGVEVAQDISPAIRLVGIRLHSPPRLDGGGGDSSSLLAFTLSCKSEVDHYEYEIFSMGRNSLNGGLWQCAMDMKAGRCDLRPQADGAFPRVAGDFNISFYRGASGPRIFHFWLHTAMLSASQGDMCGTWRSISEEELNSEGFPPSTKALILFKQEVDTAAKDRRCARFDSDFRVELFYEQLDGQCGTGEALDEARRRRAEMDSQSSAGAVELPLQWERDGYRKYLARSARQSGEAAKSMGEWLLNRRGAGGTSRSEGSLRSEYVSSSSVFLRSTSDQRIEAPVAPEVVAAGQLESRALRMSAVGMSVAGSSEEECQNRNIDSDASRPACQPAALSFEPR